MLCVSPKSSDNIQKYLAIYCKFPELFEVSIASQESAVFLLRCGRVLLVEREQRRRGLPRVAFTGARVFRVRGITTPHLNAVFTVRSIGRTNVSGQTLIVFMRFVAGQSIREL